MSDLEKLVLAVAAEEIAQERAQPAQPVAVPDGWALVPPIDAIREVIRISDRSHPSWDIVKAWLAADPAAPKRDREADRARFPDPAFNRWLDEAITENGEFTVWDHLGDTCDAWHGWQNKPFYAAPKREPLIPIPADVVEQAVDALGRFCSDEGWGSDDMQAMDNLDAYLAQHKARITKEPQ